MPAERPSGAPLTAGDSVALTGATGFLGPYLINALLAAGFSLRALTRRPQPEREGVTWVLGDLDDPFTLHRLVRGTQGLVHGAALVQARRRRDFLAVNLGGTARLVLSAGFADHPVRRAVLLSSLAARQPTFSAYAGSKRAAETVWYSLPPEIGRVILRPPGIYGPGDVQVRRLIEAGRQGLLPAPAGRQARFSMIHAEDTAAAVVAALTAERVSDAPLELSDGKDGGYAMADVAGILQAACGRRVRLMPLPRWLVRSAGLLSEIAARLTGRAAFFNAGKARELVHPDWVADPAGNAGLADWHPRIGLDQGLHALIREEAPGRGGRRRP